MHANKSCNDRTEERMESPYRATPLLVKNISGKRGATSMLYEEQENLTNKLTVLAETCFETNQRTGPAYYTSVGGKLIFMSLIESA